MLLPLDELLSGSLLAPDRCLFGSYGKSLQSGCSFLLSLLLISWLLLLLQQSRQRLVDVGSAASLGKTARLQLLILPLGPSPTMEDLLSGHCRTQHVNIPKPSALRLLAWYNPHSLNAMTKCLLWFSAQRASPDRPSTFAAVVAIFRMRSNGGASCPDQASISHAPVPAAAQ